MTCSGRRRRNRNALTIVAYVVAFVWQENRWPYREPHNESNVQTLASRVVPQVRLGELREEGVNWGYLAERLNRERLDQARRAQEWVKRAILSVKPIAERFSA